MIEKLQRIINDSKKIVFFTGAGISTASGIPDFRSSTGLYKNIYHSEEVLSHHFFMNKADDFYDFYRKYMVYPNATYNYAHKFMADLQDKKDVTIVTQNIDGLHQLAGSKKVYELHGTIHSNHCMRCGKYYDLTKIIKSDSIPRCECKGIIKPDVVLYEEGLNEDTINKAINAIISADTLVVCGTSLVVYPAASFVRYFRGNNLVIINKDKTDQDQYCDVVIHDDLVETFKKIRQAH